ncbi:MAG: 4-hydroxy-tetrahydrodipicolinate synthase [Spirochaetota bacterium]|nr:4-hydroxy-tetrahydrodipicolinate synthase [Spirochaetota bacterium]
MFDGAVVAIVTPFKNSKVDYNTFEKLIETQIKEGINGIVPCGTTGESPTLSHDEHKEVIRFTVDITKNRVPVIAGTGSNNTVEAIELTKYAKDVKANGVLIVNPYYNKPSQEGLFRHFTSIADEVNIPILLYNIQSRTGINMTAETVIRLSKHKNIVGIKEASGSLEQAMAIINGTKDFSVISGDDILTLPLCSIGGKGVISVLANILPKETSNFVSDCLKGNFAKAKEFHYNYLELIKGLFIETNPVPIKQALEFRGICSGEVRLPLCEMSNENKNRLKTLLKEKKLLP